MQAYQKTSQTVFIKLKPLGISYTMKHSPFQAGTVHADIYTDRGNLWNSRQIEIEDHQTSLAEAAGQLMYN